VSLRKKCESLMWWWWWWWWWRLQFK